MAQQKKKVTRTGGTINIKQYKTKREMNIGILIFTIVFLYLVITIFTYATSKRISVYEVRRGSIVKDYSYTGLIMRQEMLVNAESSGYISYYQNQNSKVKAGSKIYAISSEKIQNTEQTAAEDVSLTTEVEKALNLHVQNFNENFTAEKFSSVYTLKNEYTNTLQNAMNQSRNAQLDAWITANGIAAASYSSERDGIMALTYDGYENLTEENLKESDFDRGSYEAAQLSDQMEVKAGSPAYRLITSENWDVYVKLDKTTAKLLSDTTMIKVRIDKDNETAWADFSIIKKEDQYYGHLQFHDSMIRYCEERFLNVELILEDQSGLKIPKSAVIEKSFYTVPEDYLTTSGSGSSQGVMVKDKNEVKYVSAEVYSISEDGYAYLNTADFDKNATLVKPESNETYVLKEERMLRGVYNINQGYAVFKVVDILCENDDYFIVQEGTSYGISDYDHIIQDGTTVEEEEVVF